ncbi:MAG: cobalt-precorrin-6A reductase [Gammaproteobacteria bacterium]|nr:cobalt-precorrin-6A reductase [Gammaproteobacteria bacterium]
MTSRVLILGGTTQARMLGSSLLTNSLKVEVVYSLAGRTQRPNLIGLGGAHIRRGGFNGASGLARFVHEHCVDFVVDATHPFAAQISAHALAAATIADVPLLRLSRMPWCAHTGDQWTHCSDVRSAAEVVQSQPTPSLQRVFLAIGTQEVAVFARGAQSITYWVRVIEPPKPCLDADQFRVIRKRGPFSEAEEEATFRDLGIQLLVCKNSGGRAMYPKLAAARTLSIPVLMIDRPCTPNADTVYEVESALKILRERLDL